MADKYIVWYTTDGSYVDFELVSSLEQGVSYGEAMRYEWEVPVSEVYGVECLSDGSFLSPEDKQWQDIAEEIQQRERKRREERLKGKPLKPIAAVEVLRPSKEEGMVWQESDRVYDQKSLDFWVSHVNEHIGPNRIRVRKFE